MHPSTTAKITATEYINGIFLQIHMFRFFIDLCILRNACHEYYYFASLGTFMHQGYRMQRLKKSLNICCMDKRLLEIIRVDKYSFCAIKSNSSLVATINSPPP